MSEKRNTVENAQGLKDISQKIAAAIQGLRYGSVEITIHNGRIVQIEHREKQRLEFDDFSKAT